MHSLPAGAEETIILKAAFAKAIQIVWAVMCGLGGAALLASLFVDSFDLNQALVTEQGFVDGKKSIGLNEKHGELGELSGKSEEAIHTEPEGA